MTPIIGDMVVTRRGRIGLLSQIWPNAINQAVVQFGAAGPFRAYKLGNLRRATMQEIEEAGLHGVGCNQAEEST